jgi:serine/threonine protein kinase
MVSTMKDTNHLVINSPLLSPRTRYSLPETPCWQILAGRRDARDPCRPRAAGVEILWRRYNGLEMETMALGRYEIRNELGRGTMGVVYRAWDPTIDRLAAVKTILVPESIPERDRKEYLQRFALEAKIAGKLNHPNIVITYDAATDPETGTPYIAMELVDGESLSSLLEQHGRLRWPEALEIVVPVALALDHAHRQGIVHRDIKPPNILLTRDGVPKITDFGIAKLTAGSITRKGVILGTPYFMSPEQLRGETLDGRSDIFCLASVLYACLVGQPPFTGTELGEILHKLVSEAPRPPHEAIPDVPRAFDDVLACAMAKSPEDRYPSGVAFADALRAIDQDQETDEQPVSLAARLMPEPGAAAGKQAPDLENATTVTAPKSSRRRTLLLLLLSLLLAGAASVVVLGPEQARRQTQPVLETMRSCAVWLRERIATLRQAQEQRENRQALSDRAHSALASGAGLAVRGHWQQALAELDRSLALFQEAEDGTGEAAALLARGRLYSYSGDWLKAAVDLQTAAAVSRVYADPEGEARATICSGNLERDQGRFGRAVPLYLRAEALLQHLQGSRVVSEARLERSLNDLLRRRPVVLEDQATPVTASEPGVRTLLLRGVASFVEGQSVAAFSYWEEARRNAAELPRSEQPDLLLAEVSLMVGYATLETGLLAESRAHLEAAERSFRETEHLPGLAAVLESLARLADREEHATERQRLLDEASAIRQQLGLQPQPQAAVAAAPETVEQEPASQRLLLILRATPCTAATEERYAAVAQRPDTGLKNTGASHERLP